MSTTTITDKLTDIIVEQLGVKATAVKPEASFFGDLKADSLDIVELTMAIEDEFSITITEEEAETLKTVGDAIKFIEERQ